MDIHRVCRRIGKLAVSSLHEELALAPKPGLVSLVDSGSHGDMNATTFLRSLAALHEYFNAIAALGAEEAAFDRLKACGRDAEQRMLVATGGVNTHRGAIFALGLLAAAAAACHVRKIEVDDAALRGVLLQLWGQDLARHCQRLEVDTSHGTGACRRYQARGARHEAAAGFPSVFTVALPSFQAAIRRGQPARQARLELLFLLMATIDDTNVLHRGGREGGVFVRQAAARWLAAGGTGAVSWEEDAWALHREFVSRRLSPGGAADLLSATLFVHHLVWPTWASDQASCASR